MDRLMLIVRMADEIVALPAGLVESVVEIEAMTPVPLAPAHIVGLAALRSRVVTIVDPRAVLGIDGMRSPPFVAVVVPVAGHPYGIIVDEVLDVTEAAGAPSAVQGRVAAGWTAVAHETVVIDGTQHLMIDPAKLIAGGATPAGQPAGAVH